MSNYITNAIYYNVCNKLAAEPSNPKSQEELGKIRTETLVSKVITNQLNQLPLERSMAVEVFHNFQEKQLLYTTL